MRDIGANPGPGAEGKMNSSRVARRTARGGSLAKAFISAPPAHSPGRSFASASLLSRWNCEDND